MECIKIRQKFKREGGEERKVLNVLIRGLLPMVMRVFVKKKGILMRYLNYDKQ